ncbi:MAG: hypothetical protein IPI29_08520 [Ignavibacteria bacterium]|nr:hypothetical protein [Ignavibacteria bacterium]
MIESTIIVAIICATFLIRERWEQRKEDDLMDTYAELVEKHGQAKYQLGFRDGVSSKENRPTLVTPTIELKATHEQCNE